MESWEERMAAKAKVRRDAEIEAEFGYIKSDEPWRFDIDHPKWVGICRVCCLFMLYNPAAPWLGYGWKQICPRDCDHAHHDNEFWLAAV